MRQRVSEAAERSPSPTRFRLTITRLEGFVQWLFGMLSSTAEGSRMPVHESHALRTHDPLSDAVVYRLKRDTLMVLARMNQGLLEPDQMRRHIVFIQHQLVMAAIRDPAISSEIKTALLSFQDMTVRDSIEDRRGSKRRRPRDASLGQDRVPLSVVRNSA